MYFLGWINRIQSSFFLLTMFLVALLVCPETAHGADKTYYRSNSMGMQFDRVSVAGSRQFEFILEIEESGGKKIKRLLSGTVEKQRTVLTYNRQGVLQRETVFVNGALDSLHEYGPSGVLVREEFYNAGNLLEKRRFFHSGVYIDRVETYNPEDLLLYTDYFFYIKGGRLGRVEREYSDGTEAVSEFSFAGGKLVGEWHGGNESGISMFYDSRGNNTYTEEWEGTELASREENRFGEEHILSSTRTDYKNDTILVQNYARDGDMSEEIEYDGGVKIRENRYQYAEGKLSEKTSLNPGLSERWVYQYDGQGELIKEIYEKNRLVNKITHYTEENTYNQELYRNGELFLRVYFEGDAKIKEEFIRKGETLRTREFSAEEREQTANEE
jgi:antitoxin component YwqK of YwqJK toxin-antitoxin module